MTASIIDGTLPQPPIAETLSLNLVAASKGRAAFEGPPELRHYNPIGTVHGGFTMTLLDSALACAIFLTMVNGDVWTTLEFKINCVRPLTKNTGSVRAEGRVLHRVRSVAISQGDLKNRPASFMPTVFNFVTFGILLWVYQAGPDLFRTGWFVESLITELVIILVIRTDQPFYRSRPGSGDFRFRAFAVAAADGPAGCHGSLCGGDRVGQVADFSCGTSTAKCAAPARFAARVAPSLG